MLGPFLPLSRAARPHRPSRSRRARRSTRVEIEFLGRIAERDTRLLTLAVLNGVLAGHTEEEVNLRQRAARWPRSAASPSSETHSHQRPRLHRPRAGDRGRSGDDRVRVVGHHARAPPPPAPARGLGAALQHPAGAPHLAVFATPTCPGMIGRVGTVFGEHGDQHRVGRRRPPARRARTQRRRPRAAMAITTDAPVPREVVDEILALDGFVDGSVPSRSRTRFVNPSYKGREVWVDLACVPSAAPYEEDGRRGAAHRPGPAAPASRRRPGRRGSRQNALGFLSSVVIGVASTAPGYSLAAILGLHRRGGASASSPRRSCGRVPADAAHRGRPTTT